MNKTALDKLCEGRQYRMIDCGQIELRDDGDKKEVTGYATVFSQPYKLYSYGNYTVREQIDPAAFDNCDMSDVIMQYNHEGRVFARLSNGTLKLAVDKKGLKITADLGGTELGRQLYEEIKGGYTTKMSFGFTVKKDKREVVEDNETGAVDVLRTITDIEKLYDVSAVSLPANDATEISSRTFGEGLIAEVKQEIAERMKKQRQKQKIKILSEVLY